MDIYIDEEENQWYISDYGEWEYPFYDNNDDYEHWDNYEEDYDYDR